MGDRDLLERDTDLCAGAKRGPHLRGLPAPQGLSTALGRRPDVKAEYRAAHSAALRACE